jgi:glucose/arabinose dehydrogenase
MARLGYGVFGLCLALLWLATACTQAPAGGSAGPQKADRGRGATATPEAEAAVEARPTTTLSPLPANIRTETVADGLALPVNLAFAPDGRLFFTEVQRGTVRVIDHGQLVADPVLALDVANDGEEGLLGLALDPDFGRTHAIYLYYSQPRGGKGWRNRVVRVTEAANRAGDLQVVLDDIPINNHYLNASHNGGRVAFGPDGKLYVTVGDMGSTPTAQDHKSLAGKILRINPDGSIPADNPFPGSPIYALGLRNSYGLTFHPTTGALYATDNGPEGHDEVNRIVAGGNYGSPEVNGIRNNPRFIDPIWESHADRGGITGLTFYRAGLFPQYDGDLLFCTFTSGRLRRLHLGGAQLDQVQSEDVLSTDCNLDVANGPDGAIYIAAVNRILRLVPVV